MNETNDTFPFHSQLAAQFSKTLWDAEGLAVHLNTLAETDPSDDGSHLHYRKKLMANVKALGRAIGGECAFMVEEYERAGAVWWHPVGGDEYDEQTEADASQHWYNLVEEHLNEG